MVLSRPKDKHDRSRQLRRMRMRGLDALTAIDDAKSPKQRAEALEKCREALHSLLLGTLSPKMIEELSADYPTLLQPSLFSLPLRSPSE